MGGDLGESLNSEPGPKEGFFFFLQINVFFATSKKKLSIVFFFAVQSRGFFDICFFLSLGYLGLSPTRLRRLSLGGMGPSWVKSIKGLTGDPFMY